MSINFVKRIDDLGRIVIPKEIRRILKIDNNENMEITLENREIVIKKHSLLEDNKKELVLLGTLLNKLTNENVIITNRDRIIYTNEPYNNKDISEELKNKIINRKELDNEYELDICYDIKIKAFYYSKNIIINSDTSGMIIIYSNNRINDEYKKIVNIIAEILSI